MLGAFLAVGEWLWTEHGSEDVDDGRCRLALMMQKFGRGSDHDSESEESVWNFLPCRGLDIRNEIVRDLLCGAKGRDRLVQHPDRRAKVTGASCVFDCALENH